MMIFSRKKAAALALALSLVSGTSWAQGEAAAETALEGPASEASAEPEALRSFYDLHFSQKAEDAQPCELSLDGTVVKFRAYAPVVYAGYAAVPEEQSLTLYVPEKYFSKHFDEIGEYATKNAPILVPLFGSLNSEEAMEPSEDGEGRLLLEALSRGYVVASLARRGLDSGAAGKSPASLVDVKAAVQYLRYNKGALPAGSTNRIVLLGRDMGATLAACAAASGDSDLAKPFLHSAGAGEVSNRVFAAIAYGPAGDYAHLDAMNDWLFGSPREFSEYVNSLGLKDEAGEALTLGASGSGSFYDYTEELLSRALARGEEASYISYDTGRGQVNLAAFAAHLSKGGDIPVFDRADLSSAENLFFGTSVEERKHFRAGGEVSPRALTRYVELYNPFATLGKRVHIAQKDEEPVERDRAGLAIGIERDMKALRAMAAGTAAETDEEEGGEELEAYELSQPSVLTDDELAACVAEALSLYRAEVNEDGTLSFAEDEELMGAEKKEREPITLSELEIPTGEELTEEAFKEGLTFNSKERRKYLKKKVVYDTFTALDKARAAREYAVAHAASYVYLRQNAQDPQVPLAMLPLLSRGFAKEGTAVDAAYTFGEEDGTLAFDWLDATIEGQKAIDENNGQIYKLKNEKRARAKFLMDREKKRAAHREWKLSRRHTKPTLEKLPVVSEGAAADTSDAAASAQVPVVEEAALEIAGAAK